MASLSRRIDDLEGWIRDLEYKLEETDGYARGGAGLASDTEERLNALYAELASRRLIRSSYDPR